MTIKTDVPPPAFNYLLEHREAFPGVVVEKKYLRNYPFKTLGAQLFGTLREISPDELKEKRYRGVSAGTRIGKDGIEETYDKYLRGTDGYSRVIVNSSGNRDDTRRTTRVDPIQGRQVRLTLDLGLQRASQTRSRGRSRRRPATAPTRAPTSRSIRATARCSRSARTRASTRTCSRSRSTSAPTTA